MHRARLARCVATAAQLGIEMEPKAGGERTAALVRRIAVDFEP